MERPLAKMLSLVYEIEGLLLVAEKHEADTPQFVYEMLAEKAARLQALSEENLASPAATPSPTENAAAPAEPAVAEAAATVAPPSSAPAAALPADDYDSDDTSQHDSGEEPAEIFHSDYVEPARAAAPAPPVHPLGSDYVPADDDDSDLPPSDEPLRLDQKLQRTIARDLRSAFSLNDRFRFRRELFSNSEAEMADALNLIGAMHSYDEAADYFFGTLGWDEQNVDVADFMAIIRNHFA